MPASQGSGSSAFGAEKSKVLVLLAAAQFLVVLDASITNVALPSIGRALEIRESSLAWVVNSYVLFFGGFLLLGGRMADLIGRRRMFMSGLVLFAVASLTAGLAQNEAMLIVSRAAQGLGAAMLSPAALSIVTATFAEGKQRNKALGVWGAVAGAGGAVGVLLGGILTEYLSWRWVFLVNVPVVAIVLPLVLRIVPESHSGEDHNDFDIPGAVTVTAGLSMLVYALIDAESAGWLSDADTRPVRRLTGPARPLRLDRVPGCASAGSVRHLRLDGPATAPTSSACCWPLRSSRCSSSSRCIRSASSAGTR